MERGIYSSYYLVQLVNLGVGMLFTSVLVPVYFKLGNYPKKKSITYKLKANKMNK